MTERLSKREGVPRYTQHPLGALDVWVDWSGYTAVAVCALCGHTEFAGMDTPSGFGAAFAHRKTHAELADIKTYPHLRKPLCAWGYSEWGEGLGETCDLLPKSGDYCQKHTARVKDLLDRGTCSVDECWTVAMERQHLCHVHAREWAKSNGIMFDALGKRGSVVIP